MLTLEDVKNLPRSMLGGTDGMFLGEVARVYVEQHSGLPEWALVRTGLPVGRECWVPLAHAVMIGGAARVPYQKGQVNGAPHTDQDPGCGDQQFQLYAHYALARPAMDAGFTAVSGYAPGAGGGW